MSEIDKLYAAALGLNAPLKIERVETDPKAPEGDTRARPASLYPGEKVLAFTAVYNEETRVAALAKSFAPGIADQFLVINDGSTDASAEILRSFSVLVLDQPHSGLGASIKHAIRYARSNGFTIVALFAGNGKDDPRQIPLTLAPILEGRADYVQGSRYLRGGSHENTPLFRLLAIRTLSWLFSAYMRKRCTDLTNGFRAYRTSLFEDKRFDVEQEWLDNYEYEYYLHWYVYKLGYRVVEVPVSKTYPTDKRAAYSKVKPFVGWWRMLRPLVFLTLGIKK